MKKTDKGGWRTMTGVGGTFFGVWKFSVPGERALREMSPTSALHLTTPGSSTLKNLLKVPAPVAAAPTSSSSSSSSSSAAAAAAAAGGGGAWEAAPNPTPPLPPTVALARRIDLRTIPRDSPTSILGWTGNTVFNRALANYYNVLGYHYNGGGCRPR